MHAQLDPLRIINQHGGPRCAVLYHMAAFFVASFFELSFMLMCAYLGVRCLALHTFLYEK